MEAAFLVEAKRWVRFQAEGAPPPPSSESLQDDFLPEAEMREQSVAMREVHDADSASRIVALEAQLAAVKDAAVQLEQHADAALSAVQAELATALRRADEAEVNLRLGRAEAHTAALKTLESMQAQHESTLRRAEEADTLLMWQREANVQLQARLTAAEAALPAARITSDAQTQSGQTLQLREQPAQTEATTTAQAGTCTTWTEADASTATSPPAAATRLREASTATEHRPHGLLEHQQPLTVGEGEAAVGLVAGEVAVATAYSTGHPASSSQLATPPVRGDRTSARAHSADYSAVSIAPPSLPSARPLQPLVTRPHRLDVPAATHHLSVQCLIVEPPAPGSPAAAPVGGTAIELCAMPRSGLLRMSLIGPVAAMQQVFCIPASFTAAEGGRGEAAPSPARGGFSEAAALAAEVGRGRQDGVMVAVMLPGEEADAVFRDFATTAVHALLAAAPFSASASMAVGCVSDVMSRGDTGASEPHSTSSPAATPSLRYAGVASAADAEAVLQRRLAPSASHLGDDGAVNTAHHLRDEARVVLVRLVHAPGSAPHPSSVLCLLGTAAGAVRRRPSQPPPLPTLEIIASSGDSGAAAHADADALSSRLWTAEDAEAVLPPVFAALRGWCSARFGAGAPPVQISHPLTDLLDDALGPGPAAGLLPLHCLLCLRLPARVSNPRDVLAVPALLACMQQVCALCTPPTRAAAQERTAAVPVPAARESHHDSNDERRAIEPQQPPPIEPAAIASPESEAAVQPHAVDATDGGAPATAMREQQPQPQQRDAQPPTPADSRGAPAGGWRNATRGGADIALRLQQLELDAEISAILASGTAPGQGEVERASPVGEGDAGSPVGQLDGPATPPRTAADARVAVVPVAPPPPSDGLQQALIGIQVQLEQLQVQQQALLLAQLQQGPDRPSEAGGLAGEGRAAVATEREGGRYHSAGPAPAAVTDGTSWVRAQERFSHSSSSSRGTLPRGPVRGSHASTGTWAISSGAGRQPPSAVAADLPPSQRSRSARRARAMSLTRAGSAAPSSGAASGSSSVAAEQWVAPRAAEVDGANEWPDGTARVTVEGQAASARPASARRGSSGAGGAHAATRAAQGARFPQPYGSAEHPSPHLLRQQYQHPEAAALPPQPLPPSMEDQEYRYPPSSSGGSGNGASVGVAPQQPPLRREEARGEVGFAAADGTAVGPSSRSHPPRTNPISSSWAASHAARALRSLSALDREIQREGGAVDAAAASLQAASTAAASRAEDRAQQELEHEHDEHDRKGKLSATASHAHASYARDDALRAAAAAPHNPHAPEDALPTQRYHAAALLGRQPQRSSASPPLGRPQPWAAAVPAPEEPAATTQQPHRCEELLGDPVPGMRQLLHVLRQLSPPGEPAFSASGLLAACAAADPTRGGRVSAPQFTRALSAYAPALPPGEARALMVRMHLHAACHIDYTDFVVALDTLARRSDPGWAAPIIA